MFPGASAFRCPPASPDGMTEGLQSWPCPGQPGGLAPETGGGQVGVWRPTGGSPWNGSGPLGGSQKSKGGEGRAASRSREEFRVQLCQ